MADRLRRELGLDEPFRDPGVGVFGLENAVFAVGDTFLEVVAPVQPDTTAGRYLQRRGGDSGYMAIYAGPLARRGPPPARRAGCARRLDGGLGRHRLYPPSPQGCARRDRLSRLGESAGVVAMGRAGVDGHRACTSVRRHRRPDHRGARSGGGGQAMGRRAGTATRQGDGNSATVSLGGGRQELRFVPLGDARVEGITELTLTMADVSTSRETVSGGVRLLIDPILAEGEES